MSTYIVRDIVAHDRPQVTVSSKTAARDYARRYGDAEIITTSPRYLAYDQTSRHVATYRDGRCVSRDIGLWRWAVR